MGLTVLIGVLLPRTLGFLPCAMALVFGLCHVASTQRLPPGLWRLCGYACIFPVLMLLSALWSPWPETALLRGLESLPVFLGGALLLALTAVADDHATHCLRRVYPVLIAVAALFCCFELYLDAPLHRAGGGSSPNGEFNFSKLNRSVIVLVLCAVPVTVLGLNGALRKFQALALIAPIALVLAATESQSAWLTVLVFALVTAAGWFLPVLARRLLIGGVGVALFASVFVFPWLFRTLSGFLATHDILKNAYALNRLEIWDFISRRALESPLLGFGAEATRNIKDFDTQALFHSGTQILHPHNFMLQLWIEFGVLGPLAALGIFVLLIQGGARTGSRAGQAVGLGLFAATVAAASVSYGLWQGWWLGCFSLLPVLVRLLDKGADNPPST